MANRCPDKIIFAFLNFFLDNILGCDMITSLNDGGNKMKLKNWILDNKELIEQEVLPYLDKTSYMKMIRLIEKEERKAKEEKKMLDKYCR